MRVEKMAGQKTARIVFVDDYEMILRYYEKQYKRSPFRNQVDALFFDDNAKAMDYLKRFGKTVHGIVRDINMGDDLRSAFTGIDFARIIKSTINSDIVFVFHSGASDVQDAVSALSLSGGSYFIQKGNAPVQDVFEEAIEHIIRCLGMDRETVEVERAQMRQVILPTWRRICLEISRDHTNLHRIPPREFEHLVALMFEDEGCEVQLTAQTRDGGFDIIALRKTGLVSTKLLIEAKRYAPWRKVSVGEIRSFYGVRQHNSASQLVLATTSCVSHDAKVEFEKVIPYELDFIERDRILDWCDQQAGVRLKGEFPGRGFPMF